MTKGTARRPSCTVQRSWGDFCEQPSAEDVPFPICSHHALELVDHLADVRRDTLAAGVTRISPRNRSERVEQTRAIKAITAGKHTIYAVQFPDGVIKIGCTGDLAARYNAYVADGGQIVGFRFGGFDDELALHKTLEPHRARAREWYHPTAEVLAVVNAMRESFNMPPLDQAA